VENTQLPSRPQLLGEMSARIERNVPFPYDDWSRGELSPRITGVKRMTEDKPSHKTVAEQLLLKEAHRVEKLPLVRIDTSVFTFLSNTT